jgi:hypothetical protein
MNKGLGQIFWGLLFTVLDLKISEVDILPDVVGYMIVAMGCTALSTVSRHFSLAAQLAWVLFILSVLVYALSGGVLTGVSFLAIVIDIAMLWQILAGVMELAKARGRGDLAGLAECRRKEYLVASILGTVMMMLVSRGGMITGMMALLLWVFLFVVLCLILDLIHRMKREMASEQ